MRVEMEASRSLMLDSRRETFSFAKASSAVRDVMRDSCCDMLVRSIGKKVTPHLFSGSLEL